MARASGDTCDLYQIISAILAEHASIKEMEAKVTKVTECDGECRTGRHEFQITLPEGTKWRYIQLVLNIKTEPTPREQ